MKIIFISLKRNVLPIIFVLITISLVLFSKSNLIAAKNGLTLWANAIVPALFPFFVITELLSNTNIIYYLGKLFNKLMRPLFNVPGEGAFAFIMGLISGYPVGAKIVANLREQKLCTKEEGDRMLAFTNNSGPLFIISSVGVALFGDTKTGLLLLFTHILACITVGIILAKFSKNKKTDYNFSKEKIKNGLNIKREPVSFSKLGEILGKSINNAISTTLMIGGFVVMFSVIISILQHSNILEYVSKIFIPILSVLGLDIDFAQPILSGIVELTNGLNLVSKLQIKSISQNVVICAFLLGFGGISVMLQVFSFLGKTDLSIKTYIKGKLMQGIFAAIYTYIALKLIPFLNLDIAPVCAPIADVVIYPIHFFSINNYLLLLLVLLFIFWLVFCHNFDSNDYRKKSISK